MDVHSSFGIDFWTKLPVSIQTMTFYKAFDENLCCRGLQYTVGETTAVEGEIEMCVNGIHCCSEAIACLDYYPRDSRFCQVLPVGERFSDGNKTVCGSLTVVREIVGKELTSLLSGQHKIRDVHGQMGLYNFKDGLMDGPSTGWHENGQVWFVSTFKKGILGGPCKSWYDNGQLCEECSYKNGKLDGLRKKWDMLGHLMVECSYKNGKLDGPRRVWYNNGQLSSELEWKNGKVRQPSGCCRLA